MPKTPTRFSTNLFFEEHALLIELYGEQDEHLKILEKLLNVEAVARGNMLSLSGAKHDVELVETILLEFYDRIKHGEMIDAKAIEAAVLNAPVPVVTEPYVSPKKATSSSKKHSGSGDVVIKTLKKTIAPYSHMQANYIRSLYDHDLVFALGPAGTGKTYLAVAMAVYMFINHRVERIILSRPAVEAGEKLGFLPGDMKEKVDPYLRPLYDALFDMMPAEQVNHMIEKGEIEVAPLAFMRGRTLSNAFIILDEAQNTTSTQMKMFLTRLGENSRMVINGDVSQIDLPKDVKSGLRDVTRKIHHIDGISIVHFSDTDVVRHALAAKIVQAYNDWDNGIRPPRYKYDDGFAEERDYEGSA